MKTTDRTDQLLQLTRSSLNPSRALRLVWRLPGISRSEIARQLNLDKSTVSDIISILLRQEIIRERNSMVSTPYGGRPPIGLEINVDFGAVAGIDLQPDHYKLLLLSLDGQTLRSMRIHTRVRPENIVAILSEAVSKAREELQTFSRPLLGVGAGITGIIDSDAGAINHSIPLQIFNPIPVQHPVAERTGTTITIDNDANCCAWGEIAFHPAGRQQDFIYVLVETGDPAAPDERTSGIGIGLSFVLGGKVYRGADYTAGEFRSLFRKRNSNSQFSLKNTDTYRIHTDPTIRRAFLRELARHIALFSNTLNLNHVFLGGDIDELADELMPVLHQEREKNWAYKGVYDIPLNVSTSDHGKDAVAIGAAGMMLEELFDVPSLKETEESSLKI